MARELPTTAEIVIVGGGVIGLGIAYHLAEAGCTDVVVLERHSLTSGTSWHAAGIVGPLRATYDLTLLSRYAAELFSDLESLTGQATGYKRTGGLWLAGRPERMVELERTRAMGDLADLHARIVTPDEVAERVPGMEVGDLAGAMWVDEDGQADATGVCMAYAAGARRAGVAIHEGVTATGVVVDDGRVVGIDVVPTAGGDPSTIGCRAMVNAAGVWSRRLGDPVGVALPVQGVQHMYVVTEGTDDLPEPFPIVRDLEHCYYLKSDASQLLVGGFEFDAKAWDPEGPDGDTPFLEMDEDWDQFGPVMEAAIRRYPTLGETGLRFFMNGPESFTHDTAQVIGEAPDLEGYFVATGFNSLGLTASAGVGKVMAEWLTTGVAPDQFGLDIARVDPLQAGRDHLRERLQEAVGEHFSMHWPFKQITAGRGLRHTPFHGRWTGAQYGATATWERPLWFGDPVEPDNVAPRWWPMAEAEVAAMVDGVALIELTPFAKFDVTGPDALALLQWLCVSDLDVPVGAATYTQMANDRGGIEADLTVVRRGPDEFRVTDGAPTRWRTGGRLRRMAHRLGQAHGWSVSVTDLTEDEAVLGVMGPRSAELLAAHADPGDLDAFGFGTSRTVAIDGVEATATRISYVGELGWELSIPGAGAARAFDALVAEGNGSGGPSFLGLYAMDACRHEKGYRHWGDDLGPLDTVLEAGLGFTIGWDVDFLGRDALAAQKEVGITHRLRQFAVDGAHPLVLHDEPVFCDGVVVGRTTSGARGFRTGRTLCLADVEVDADGEFEVLVAGVRHPLERLVRPPYDPTGSRMRPEGQT